MERLDESYPTVYQLHRSDERIKKKLRKNLRCPQEGSTTVFEISSKPCRISKNDQHVKDATTPYTSNGVSDASFGQMVKEFDSLRDPKTKNRVATFFST